MTVLVLLRPYRDTYRAAAYANRVLLTRLVGSPEDLLDATMAVSFTTLVTDPQRLRRAIRLGAVRAGEVRS